MIFVARTGFEPVICWLRTNRPSPLDERAMALAGGEPIVLGS